MRGRITPHRRFGDDGRNFSSSSWSTAPARRPPGPRGRHGPLPVAPRLTDAESYPPPRSKLASSAGPRFPLEISPDPVQLGVLAPGRSADANIVLRNPGIDLVLVERIESSCPCLGAGRSRIQMAPGESCNLSLRFDPSHDADFRGRLSINVAGYDAAGRTVFGTQVHLEVHAEAANNTGLAGQGSDRAGTRSVP